MKKSILLAFLAIAGGVDAVSVPSLGGQAPVVLVDKRGVRVSFCKGSVAVRSAGSDKPVTMRQLREIFKKRESTIVTCLHPLERNPFTLQITFDATDDAAQADQKIPARSFTDVRIYGQWDTVPTHVKSYVEAVAVPGNKLSGIGLAAAGVAGVVGIIASQVKARRAGQPQAQQQIPADPARAQGTPGQTGATPAPAHAPIVWSEEREAAERAVLAPYVNFFWNADGSDTGCLQPKTIAGRLVKALTQPGRRLSRRPVVAIEQLKEGALGSLLNAAHGIVIVGVNSCMMLNGHLVYQSIFRARDGGLGSSVFFINDSGADNGAAATGTNPQGLFMHKCPMAQTEGDINALSAFNTPEVVLAADEHGKGSGFYRFWDQHLNFSRPVA